MQHIYLSGIDFVPTEHRPALLRTPDIKGREVALTLAAYGADMCQLSLVIDSENFCFLPLATAPRTIGRFPFPAMHYPKDYILKTLEFYFKPTEALRYTTEALQMVADWAEEQSIDLSNAVIYS